MRDEPFGNYRLFTSGQLRSPLTELFEGDMIFITKKRNESLYKRLTETGLKEVYFVPFRVEGFKSDKDIKIEPHGQDVFFFAGIGNFESFIACLKEINIKIGRYRKFIGNKRYTQRTIKKYILSLKRII